MSNPAPTTVFDDIENAIPARLKAAGLVASQFGALDVDDLTRFKLLAFPAINVAVTQIDFQRSTMTAHSGACTVAVSIAVHNVKSEEAQRRMLFPLLMAVLQMLTETPLQLGDPALDIAAHPLTPQRATKTWENAGISIWRMEFRTRVTIRPLAPADMQAFVELATSYYLDPTEHVGPDAGDVLELPQE